MDPGEPGATPERPAVAGLRTGAVAFLIIALLGQLCAWVTALDLPGEALSIAQTVKLGALYLVGFLGATVNIAATDPVPMTAVVGIPLMAGTITVVILGARCGRGTISAALCFGGLCGVLALVVASAPLSVVEGSVTLVPAAISAAARGVFLFGAPAVLSAWARRSDAVALAAGGAWRMLAVALVTGGVLMVILLPAEPRFSDAAFAGLREAGSPGGTAASVNNLLVYPSEAASILAVSMGGCAGVRSGDRGRDVCGANIARPESASEGPLIPLGPTLDIPPAPASFRWFIVAPIAGVVFAGMWVGRRLARGAWPRRRMVGVAAATSAAAALALMVGAVLSAARLQEFDFGIIAGGGWRIGPVASSLVVPAVVWCGGLGVLSYGVGRWLTRRSVAHQEATDGCDEATGGG